MSTTITPAFLSAEGTQYLINNINNKYTKFVPASFSGNTYEYDGTNRYLSFVAPPNSQGHGALYIHSAQGFNNLTFNIIAHPDCTKTPYYVAFNIDDSTGKWQNIFAAESNYKIFGKCKIEKSGNSIFIAAQKGNRLVGTITQDYIYVVQNLQETCANLFSDGQTAININTIGVNSNSTGTGTGTGSSGGNTSGGSTSEGSTSGGNTSGGSTSGTGGGTTSQYSYDSNALKQLNVFYIYTSNPMTIRKKAFPTTEDNGLLLTSGHYGQQEAMIITNKHFTLNEIKNLDITATILDAKSDYNGTIPPTPIDFSLNIGLISSAKQLINNYPIFSPEIICSTRAIEKIKENNNSYKVELNQYKIWDLFENSSSSLKDDDSYYLYLGMPYLTDGFGQSGILASLTLSITK